MRAGDRRGLHPAAGLPGASFVVAGGGATRGALRAVTAPTVCQHPEVPAALAIPEKVFVSATLARPARTRASCAGRRGQAWAASREGRGREGSKVASRQGPGHDTRRPAPLCTRLLQARPLATPPEPCPVGPRLRPLPPSCRAADTDASTPCTASFPRASAECLLAQATHSSSLMRAAGPEPRQLRRLFFAPVAAGRPASRVCRAALPPHSDCICRVLAPRHTERVCVAQQPARRLQEHATGRPLQCGSQCGSCGKFRRFREFRSTAAPLLCCCSPQSRPLSHRPAPTPDQCQACLRAVCGQWLLTTVAGCLRATGCVPAVLLHCLSLAASPSARARACLCRPPALAPLVSGTDERPGVPQAWRGCLPGTAAPGCGRRRGRRSRC